MPLNTLSHGDTVTGSSFLFLRSESMSTTSPLAGRTALVTGASAGIGLETARTLARAGAAVAVTARRPDRLEALCQEIESAGGRALPIAGDVASLEDVQNVVERTHEAFGSLDILVNNAGIMRISPITENRVEDCPLFSRS
jgi:NADP-dependent 3-hydroxy acid dehydrogenase YdfG